MNGPTATSMASAVGAQARVGCGESLQMIQPEPTDAFAVDHLRALDLPYHFASLAPRSLFLRRCLLQQTHTITSLARQNRPPNPSLRPDSLRSSSKARDHPKNTCIQTSTCLRSGEAWLPVVKTGTRTAANGEAFWKEAAKR